MPIYQVDTKGEDAKRLVRAPSAPAAIAHCASERFSATLVRTVDDAAALLEAGVKIETVGAPAAETKPDAAE